MVWCSCAQSGNRPPAPSPSTTHTHARTHARTHAQVHVLDAAAPWAAPPALVQRRTPGLEYFVEHWRAAGGAAAAGEGGPAAPAPAPVATPGAAAAKAGSTGNRGQQSQQPPQSGAPVAQGGAGGGRLLILTNAHLSGGGAGGGGRGAHLSGGGATGGSELHVVTAPLSAPGLENWRPLQQAGSSSNAAHNNNNSCSSGAGQYVATDMDVFRCGSCGGWGAGAGRATEVPRVSCRAPDLPPCNQLVTAPLPFFGPRHQLLSNFNPTPPAHPAQPLCGAVRAAPHRRPPRSQRAAPAPAGGGAGGGGWRAWACARHRPARAGGCPVLSLPCCGCQGQDCCHPHNTECGRSPRSPPSCLCPPSLPTLLLLQVPLPDWALHVSPGLNADPAAPTLRLTASSPLHPPTTYDYSLTAGVLQPLATAAPPTAAAAELLRRCTLVRLSVPSPAAAPSAAGSDGGSGHNNGGGVAQVQVQVPVTLVLPPGVPLPPAAAAAAAAGTHGSSWQVLSQPDPTITLAAASSPETAAQPAVPAAGPAPVPVLLHVYGAYGLPLEPQYDGAALCLLSRGWALAWVHVRGGEPRVMIAGL